MMRLPHSNANYALYNQEIFLSMTVGDYQDRLSSPSTSCLIDQNYKPLPCSSSNYLELQELINSWINEPNDYDTKEWPEIEKELKDHRLKFPHDF